MCVAKLLKRFCPPLTSLWIQSKFTIHSFKLNFLGIWLQLWPRRTLEKHLRGALHHIHFMSLMAFEVDGTVPFADSVELNEWRRSKTTPLCTSKSGSRQWKVKKNMIWKYVQPSGFDQQRNRQRSCFFRFCFFPIMPKTISCGSLRAAISSSAVNFIGVRLVPPLTFSTFKRHSQQTNTFSTNIPRKIWGCDIGCCLITSIAAMNALNGQDLQGARLEISLAKVFDN